ncbi:MAG: hypothetical protein NTY09_01055 [bacterium]|nr:hypothetical protein [bacterium]
MIEGLLNDIDIFLQKIREFASDDLGCGCPENVFEQIRFLRGEASPGNTNLGIVIGERLLILFADEGEIKPFESEMPRLILSGVTYRDSIGLNRFRLVLTGPFTKEQKTSIEREIAKYGDKVHSHYF